ncbi:hypothetical protein CASFOL_012540 [Castilleja foliolosa]|uniref:PHD-type domain-containing protein n=1 Tax=Castilleja foliolosa TaxID=1961234 RepID=A0ABD3DLH6_9LAMI
MVDTYKESNGCVSRSVFRSLVTGPNVEAGNGDVLRAESGSTESRFDGLLTYKRRRTNNVAESEKTTQDSVSQVSEKSMKHEHNQAQCCQIRSDAPTDSFNNCSLKHQRNIILEQIFQSLDSEGSLKKCIQNALVSHPGSEGVKESVHCSEERSKCTSQTGTLHDLPNVGMTMNGCVNDSKDYTVTEHCERTFSDIIMSEKFAQLCNLLVENFQGVNADKIFDFKHINSRMKENIYGSSPLRFQLDLQEIWTKLHKVGSDITALAKGLSEKTTALHEQFLTQESDLHTKAEQTETHPLDEAHTCRCCRQKADGKNGLVCDSCEGMYHISCIEPPVKEIPTRSWYCSDCAAKEIESSHENCVACERLSTSYREDSIDHDKMTDELDKSSNGFFSEEETNKEHTYTHCKVCRTEVRCDKDDYRICGHSYCPHKFYHVNCLTSKQLTSHGPCWYCPSCLCRGCLTDRDDGNIVLCDGCDHGYHFYCMHPPRSDIPEGNWFCENCESGIERIREARRMYEVTKSVSRKRGLNGKLKGKEALNKSGGVDMLLNAAKTLNFQDKLASMGLKTD